MEKHLEQKVFITIIDQQNLSEDMIGDKVLYQQGGSLDVGIPWLGSQMVEIAQNSLLNGSFTVADLINESDPKQQATVMFEPCLPPEQLVILGAGHVAKALIKVAKMIGFNVIVLDDRPDFANNERLPEADRVVLESYEKVERVIDLNRRSHVVIVTQGHHHDWVCLQQAIKYPLGYLGLIGSERKIAQMKKKLLAAGFQQSAIDSIYMPIGLDIGAQTPEEIAISIAAELIKIRHGGSAASMSGNENPAISLVQANEMQFDLIKKAVDIASDSIPAAVATIFASQGSTPRKNGTSMIVKEDGGIYGTIGGGKGEAIVCEAAQKIIKSGRPSIIRINMNADHKDDLGMICGGDIQVYIETVQSFVRIFEDLGQFD